MQTTAVGILSPTGIESASQHASGGDAQSLKACSHEWEKGSQNGYVYPCFTEADEDEGE